jgi:hypothetical protein
MANALYSAWKASLLGTDVHSRIDFDADTIKMVLLDTADYTFSAAHQDYADLISVSTAADVAVATLASITTTDGTLDCADFSYTSVTGDVSEAMVLYKDSGSNATSPLALYLDTFASGMPVTPNGGDINVTVNASGILSF